MPTFLTMVVAGFPLDLTGIEQAGESADGRHDKFYGRGLTVPVDQLDAFEASCLGKADDPDQE